MNTHQVENSGRRFNPWIRALIVFVLYEVVTIGGSILLTIILPEASDLNTNILRVSLCLLYIGTFWLLIKYVDRKPFSYMGLQLNQKALIGFVIASVLTAALVFLSAYLSPFIFKQHLAAPEPSNWGDIFSAFMAAYVLQGFPEEMAYRGYLKQSLEKNPLPTVLISATLFMAMHWHHFLTFQGLEAIFEFTYPFAFGLLAGVLMYLSGSTWAAVAVHGGIHIFESITDILGFATGSYRTFVTSILMILVSVLLILKNPEKFR